MFLFYFSEGLTWSNNIILTKNRIGTLLVVSTEKRLLRIKQDYTIVFNWVFVAISCLSIWYINFMQGIVNCIVTFQVIWILHPRWACRWCLLDVQIFNLSFKGLISILIFAINCQPSFVKLPADYLDSFSMIEILLIKVIWINTQVIRNRPYILMVITFVLHLNFNPINLIIRLRCKIVLLMNILIHLFRRMKIETFACVLISTSFAHLQFEKWICVFWWLFELTKNCCGMLSFCFEKTIVLWFGHSFWFYEYLFIKTWTPVAFGHHFLRKRMFEWVWYIINSFRM